MSNQNGGEFGLFLGGTVCNASCSGCNVGIDHMKATGTKPEVYTKPILLNQIEQTFAIAAKRKFSGVKLKYAGGEGLYMARQVAAIQDDISGFARNYDIEYSQQFLTNGGLIHAYLPVLKSIADNHQGRSLEINTSIWGLDDNQIRRGSPHLTWPRVQSGLKELEQAGLPWTLHYVMDSDCGDTFLKFMQNSLDPSLPDFFGQDWKSNPFRISVGIMRHDTPYSSEQASNSWDAIKPVVNWMNKAINSGLDIPAPYSFFDYLMHPVQCSDGVSRVFPTDRTCGTGINFAAATPSGFERCHELLFDNSMLKSNIEDTLLPTTEVDPFSTDRIMGDLTKPIATAIARAFGGGGCPNDDWVYDPDGGATEFGPLQYEVYAPTTLALTLMGVMLGREQNLAPVGKYLLEIGEFVAYKDINNNLHQPNSLETIQLARKLYPDFFGVLTDIQPMLIHHDDTRIGEYMERLAQTHGVQLEQLQKSLGLCCNVWTYTIDTLNQELGGKIYRDISIAHEFNNWVAKVGEICAH